MEERRIRVGAVLTYAQHLAALAPSYLVAFLTPDLNGSYPGWRFCRAPRTDDIRPLCCWPTAAGAMEYARQVVADHGAALSVVVAVTHAPIGRAGDSRGLPTSTVIGLFTHPLYMAEVLVSGAPQLADLTEALSGWYVTDDVPFDVGGPRIDLDNPRTTDDTRTADDVKRTMGYPKELGGEA